MKLLLLLLVLAAGATVFLWSRKNPAATAEPPPVSNRFSAVTIRAGQDACPAVQALANTRFLAKEAPRLPLDECAASACQCEYQHYDDRRDDEDRREEQPAGTRYAGEQRRRTRKDRRRQKQRVSADGF